MAVPGFVQSSRQIASARREEHLFSRIAPAAAATDAAPADIAAAGPPTSTAASSASAPVSPTNTAATGTSATDAATLSSERPDRLLPMFPVPASIPSIVARLQELDPASLSPIDLVEWVAGWQQVIAAAQAEQARGFRQAVVKPGPMGDYVDDELAAALVVTRQSIERCTARGMSLHAYPVLADALRAGRVDLRKVDVILDESFVLSFDSVRAEVIGQATEAATGLTAPQLARFVRRLILAADPEIGEKRAKEARTERGVDLRWGPDSMAWVSAYLPAAAAVGAFTVLDALAGTCDQGDGRTVDQRRADAFSDLFDTILDSGQTPDGTVLPLRHGQRAAVHVTLAASTLHGLDDQPGELGGYGPIPASMARELAHRGSWTTVLTDEHGALRTDGGHRAVRTHDEHGATRTDGGDRAGSQRDRYRPGAELTRTVLARDVTCTWPGCRQPAQRCDLDHIEPFDHSDPARGGPTTAENLHALCRHHHQAKTAKVWNVRRDKATGNTIWTSPLGITYARSPIPVYCAPSVYDGTHRPPVADGPPPF